MGYIFSGIPPEICLKLAEIAKTETFIETGTYKGVTSKWAAAYFKEVHTIELSEILYNQIKAELLLKGNITPHLGDSKYILPGILKTLIGGGNIVFWLDGHECGGQTGGDPGSCPLLKELETILKRSNEDIIIIDDVRLLGNNYGEWPSFPEIFKMVEDNPDNARFVQICDDCIFIVPRKYSYMTVLYDYTLTRSKLLWDLYYLEHHKSEKFINTARKIGKKTGTYKVLRWLYRKTIKK